MIVHGRYRTGWSQVWAGSVAAIRAKVHLDSPSASVINAVRTLIDAIRQSQPDCEIVISSTTDTGMAGRAAFMKTAFGVLFPV
jgi:3-deoxy-D-manno-octulosonic-acid transferase